MLAPDGLPPGEQSVWCVILVRKPAVSSNYLHETLKFHNTYVQLLSPPSAK